MQPMTSFLDVSTRASFNDQVILLTLRVSWKRFGMHIFTINYLIILAVNQPTSLLERCSNAESCDYVIAM